VRIEPPSRTSSANRIIVEALKIELTEEDLKYLEEEYKPNPVMGHT